MSVFPFRPPSALTEGVQKKVADALREGLSYEAAASLAGVSRASVFRWLDRGEKELARREAAQDEGEATEEGDAHTERCALFALAVRHAEAEFERGELAPIRERAPRWQANAWRLERRFPRRYGAMSGEDDSIGSSSRTGVVVLPPLGADEDAPLTTDAIPAGVE